MPIIVDALPFEPEVLIQTETIDLSQEQMRTFSVMLKEQLTQEFLVQAKAQADREIRTLERLAAASEFNDSIMRICANEMGKMNPDDPPFLSIIMNRDRINEDDPYTLMILCVSSNDEFRKKRDPAQNYDHAFDIPITDFIMLSHAVKQRLYDPKFWKWYNHINMDEANVYFSGSFNEYEIGAHMGRLTKSHLKGNTVVVDRNDLKDVKEQAASIKSKVNDLVFEHDDKRWEDAKNDLFKELDRRQIV